MVTLTVGPPFCNPTAVVRTWCLGRAAKIVSWVLQKISEGSTVIVQLAVAQSANLNIFHKKTDCVGLLHFTRSIGVDRLWCWPMETAPEVSGTEMFCNYYSFAQKWHSPYLFMWLDLTCGPRTKPGPTHVHCMCKLWDGIHVRPPWYIKTHKKKNYIFRCVRLDCA